MSILEQIQNNGIIDLRLSISADEAFDNSFDDFLTALEENASIETIRFDQDFMGDLRSDSREKLMYALGQVKTLKDVYLAGGLFQIKHISGMINNAKHLQRLHLNGVVLQGVQADFDACEQTIQRHSSLKEFHIQDCIPAVSTISLDKLSRAICC